MYGVYSWNAGATAQNVIADLVALLCGAEVETLSASCNKAATSAAGAASGYVAIDAAYGVIQAAGQAGGPGRLMRLQVSAQNRIQLGVVDGWNMGSHSAAFASGVIDASGLITAAGSVNLYALNDALLVGASDWSYWAASAEVKRDGPMMGDALAPGGFVVGGYYCYMSRLKSPSAIGDLSGPSCTFASAYGAVSASAARDRAEKLYIPMVPAVLSYSSYPVGEVAGVMVTGGYGQSGDFMQDAVGDMFVIARNTSGVLLAFPKA